MQTCPRADDATTLLFGEMSREEAAAFRAHLDSCTACRLKVDELDAVLDHLPLAAPATAPPPDLRARVLRRVDEAVRAAEREQKGRRRWVLPLWAAAAVAALVIGSYSTLRVHQLQQQLEQATAHEQTIHLIGEGEALGASGRMVVARDGHATRVAFYARGLPPLAPGEAYQVWLIKDGQRTSCGVFVVDGAGHGGLYYWLPDEVEFDAVGVSREPDPFGQQPRGPRVMVSET